MNFRIIIDPKDNFLYGDIETVTFTDIQAKRHLDPLKQSWLNVNTMSKNKMIHYLHWLHFMFDNKSTSHTIATFHV